MPRPRSMPVGGFTLSSRNSSRTVHEVELTMPWLVEDRRAAKVASGEALLTESMKKYLSEKYFPRYPTKRAALLPALHHVQHEYGHIPTQALQEIAEFLELAPAEVLDTASFYEE